MTKKMLVATAVMCVMVTGCSNGRQGAQGLVGDRAMLQTEGQGAQGIPVKVRAAKEQTLANTVMYTTQAQPYKVKELNVRIKGDLSKVKVKLGDRVEAGQILFQPDKGTQDQEVATLRQQLVSADLNIKSQQSKVNAAKVSGKNMGVSKRASQKNEAQYRYNVAVKTAQTNEKLLEQGNISKQQYDESIVLRDQAKATLDQATKDLADYQNQGFAEKLNGLQVSLNDAKLRRGQLETQLEEALQKQSSGNGLSPYAGVVSTVDLKETNQLVEGKMVVMKVDPLKVKFNISESVRAFVEVGQKAMIDVQTLNKKVEGTIVGVSPFVDVATGNFTLEVEFDNQDEKILPGMVARVYVNTEVKKDTIVIPRKAILETIDQKYVFVMKENKAVKKYIKVGIIEGDLAEVIEGLDAGEQVIVSGQFIVGDQQAVKVVEE